LIKGEITGKRSVEGWKSGDALVEGEVGAERLEGFQYFGHGLIES
jgi:hypothetical protein